MTERPIIMGADSIRAILSGRKTMTRRIIKPQPYKLMDQPVWVFPNKKSPYVRDSWFSENRMRGGLLEYCPYGIPGDVLWCRETWKPSFTEYDETGSGYSSPDDPCCGYKATMTYTCGEPIPDYPITWKSPIYMAKRFARIWLEVTDVRVDKVTSLSYNDAVAEGCESVAAFHELWDKLNAKRGAAWEKEPWVWIVGFQKV